jgi:hypothetical protein
MSSNSEFFRTASYIFGEKCFVNYKNGDYIENILLQDSLQKERHLMAIENSDKYWYCCWSGSSPYTKRK